MPPRTLDQMSDPELDSYIQWLEMLDEIRLEQAQPGVAVVVPKEKMEEKKDDKKTGFDPMDILYKEPNKIVD